MTYAARRADIILALLLTTLLAVFWWIPAIPQPQWYHDFADQRSLFGIPNFLNVASNLPFLLTGAWGLWRLSPQRIRLHTSMEYWLWRIFFLCVALIGLGSGYYHLAPNDNTLFWDRLPIGMAFACLLAIACGERLSTRWVLPVFMVLMPLAIFSVMYWWWTEHQGIGDLRPYLLLQFTALAVLPFLYYAYEGLYDRSRDMPIAVLLYLAGVSCEWLDEPILALTGSLSGHTFKHLFIALSLAWLLRMLHYRKPRQTG